MITVRQENKIKGVNNLKENSTSYSRPLPALNYDELNREKLDLKEENRFIDQSKLREYANEYWERKKNKTKDSW